ncbi:hypothetical protein ABW21_db0205899 [Orbilia brochopaga]|nr:hypothetical protein ABW21_db0205899 [Drechslerella brochopaga]
MQALRNPGAAKSASLHDPQSSCSLVSLEKTASNVHRSDTDSAHARPGMGLKELENYTSSLRKENFALKLELFHKRERDRRQASASEATTQSEATKELKKLLQETQKQVENQAHSLSEAHLKISVLDQHLLNLRIHLQNCQCQKNVLHDGQPDPLPAKVGVDPSHPGPPNTYGPTQTQSTDGQPRETDYPASAIPSSLPGPGLPSFQADDEDATLPCVSALNSPCLSVCSSFHQATLDFEETTLAEDDLVLRSHSSFQTKLHGTPNSLTSYQIRQTVQARKLFLNHVALGDEVPGKISQKESDYPHKVLPGVASENHLANIHDRECEPELPFDKRETNEAGSSLSEVHHRVFTQVTSPAIIEPEESRNRLQRHVVSIAKYSRSPGISKHLCDPMLKQLGQPVTNSGSLKEFTTRISKINARSEQELFDQV